MAETKRRGRKPKAEKAAETAPVEETVTGTVTESAAETVEAEFTPTAEPVRKEPENDEVAQLKALVLQLQSQLAAQRPQVIQVMADTERVVLRFQAEVADDNLAVFGPEGMYGQVTGKTGIISVPKSEWSRFYNESTRSMMDRRWLIVLSGMDERERELYRCNYKEGEILDEMAFHKLLDMGRDLLAVFPALCKDHQAMVASRFLTAYDRGDERAKDRDLIVALNEMSKEAYRDAGKNDLRRKGLFWPIIEDMNAREAE